MGVSSKGDHIDLAWGEDSAEWDSGAVVVSDVSEPDCWTLNVALPLDRLVVGGVKPGDTVYLNIIRSTRCRDALAWVPTFTGFHAQSRLGEVVLEP